MKRVAQVACFSLSLFFIAPVCLGQALPPAGTILNPHFIGESFGFGEWTMDFDAATNKVEQTPGGAFTLVFFTGALWCPWCRSWENDMLNGPEFKQFAVDNKIALVEIDNPRRDYPEPTLLRTNVYWNAGDARNGNSGAAYLAGHGISTTDAEAVLLRNAALQAAWLTPGSARIGYPTLILLRKDGSIVGRFSGVSADKDLTAKPPTYSYDVAVNMARLQELLSMASEQGEERNNFAAWTQDHLGAEDSKSATLRAMVDTSDVYRLAAEAAMHSVITVQGTQDAPVTVTLLDAAGQTVLKQSGSLATGVPLAAEDIPDGTAYVSVSSTWTADERTNVASTVRAYTISTVLNKDAGTLGFSTSMISLPYTATNAVVAVKRAGGRYGAASLTVKLAEGTTAVAGTDFTDVFGEAGVTVTWASGETGEKTITIPVLADGTDAQDKVIALKVGAVSGAALEEGAGVFSLTLRMSDAPFFLYDEVVRSAVKHVMFDEVIPVLNTAGGKITVAKRSGRLPDGIRAVYDAAAGGLRLTGVAKKPGEYTARFQVSERRGTQVNGGSVLVTIRVADLSSVNSYAAQGFNAEGAVVDSATQRVTGVVKFSMAKTGRMTAKYRGLNGTVSLSANAWSQTSQKGHLEALFTSRTHQLTVALGADGGIQGWLTPITDDTVVPQAVNFGRVPWNRDVPASAYAGYYTLCLSPQKTGTAVAPTGYSFLTLAMEGAAARNGTVKYAGTLADGTAVSGSALLAAVSDTQGEITVFVEKKNTVLGASLTIDAYAAESYLGWPSSISACGETKAYWTYGNGGTKTGFDMELDICGGYYNSADNLTDHLAMYEGTGAFWLLAEDEVPEGQFGTASALPLLELETSEQTMKIAPGNQNPTGLRLRLAKKTGIFNGTFKVPFVDATGKIKMITATYRGVLMPGWIGDCGGCGPNEEVLPAKPFGVGAYWFNARQAVTARRGFPIIIDKAAQ